MAASMNDIKARMKSVKSTMQITKAMELVATSKLRRAKEMAEMSRPFYEILTKTMSWLIGSLSAPCPFTEKREAKRTLFIVIAGDRGLAGGYNSNVFRLTEQLANDTDALILPIGKKAFEFFKYKGRNLYSEAAKYVAGFGVGDALAISKQICEGYSAGEFDRVTLVYTKFKSMLSQVPVYEELLPFEPTESLDAGPDALIEGDIEEMLAKIIPEYVGGIVWSAICQSAASEHGARRSSMNAANKNAEEMIGELMLKFNRARQAVITQEITEIVSGAEAL